MKIDLPELKTDFKCSRLISPEDVEVFFRLRMLFVVIYKCLLFHSFYFYPFLLYFAEDHMYVVLNRFLLSHQSLDFRRVPEFFKFFYGFDLEVIYPEMRDIFVLFFLP